MKAKELIEQIMRACGGNYEREVQIRGKTKWSTKIVNVKTEHPNELILEVTG